MLPEIKNIKAALEQNDLKTASELFSKIEGQAQTHPVLLGLEGVYYAQRGYLEQALGAFAAAAEKMPRDPVLFYNIAGILRATGRLVAAEEAIRKSLRFNPLDPFTLFELAQIQTARGMHGEAIMTLL